MKGREAGSGFWLVFLLFLSGGAGIAYQVIWAKAFGAGVGHDYPATLAVVSAFFSGLALGAYLFDRYLLQRLRADWAYGILELIIAVWGAATTLAIPATNRIVVSALGASASGMRQWTIVFLAVFLCLLPATAAMGATLPATERYIFASLRRHSTALLYAANTAGAMAGALGAVFWAMPRFGLRNATLCAAVLNGCCAIVALLRMRNTVQRVHPRSVSQPERTWSRSLLLRLAVTGFLGIGFEVAMIRGLAHVLENTVYTFAALLAIYLGGTACGAAWYHRRSARLTGKGVLFGWVAGACLFSGIILRWTPIWYGGLRALWGDSLWAVAGAEMVMAAIMFLLPSVFMGATFSMLAESSLASKQSLGWAVGVNSLGGALAPIIFGLVLIPGLGLKVTLAIIAVGYVLLMDQGRMVGSVLALATAFLLAGSQDLLTRAGEKVIFFKDGLLSSVAVLESTNGARVLKVNNRFQMGGTASRIAEQRHADIPMLLHPDPKRALFIGLGTGITFATAGDYPGLQAEAVELLPEVVAAAPLFQDRPAALADPALHLRVADGRRFVLSTTNRYDVVVGDLFHPAQDGAAFLFTREHFAAVRGRLAEGGLFCQWLPLFQIDLETFDTIANTFLAVFPKAELYLLRFNVDTPAVALIGWRDPAALSAETVETKIAKSDLLREHLKAVALGDSLRLFGCRLGPVKPGAAVPLNTDDRPVVLFKAPSLTFRRHDDPGERLLALLSRFKPAEAVPALSDGTAPFRKRLEDFVEARNLFLQGLKIEETGRLAAAVELYVRTARLSGDFTAGYAQALGIATTLARQDPGRAQQILEMLAEARPERPVARQLLERLQGGRK